MNPPSRSPDAPDWLRPALAKMVDDLPDATLHELGNLMRGGFTKRAAIAERWRQLAGSNLVITPAIADVLRRGFALSHVLQHLDPAVVSLWIKPLSTTVDPAALTVALWLDPRPAVAALAVQERLKSTPPDPALGPRPWRALVQSILIAPLEKGAPPEPGPEPVPPTPAPVQPQPQVQVDLDRHRKWLKEARDKLSAATHAHQAELRTLTTTHQSALAKLESQLAECRSEIARLQSEAGTRIRQEVSTALDVQVRPWLNHVVEVERETNNATPEYERLLNEIQRAIDRQQLADRHAGNRTRLRNEHQHLLQLRERARNAASDALEPLSDWPALIRQLDAAIQSRASRLGDLHPNAPAWIADLLAELACANSVSEIDAVVSRANLLAQNGLLLPDPLALLHHRARLRRSALADSLRNLRPVRVPRISDVLADTHPGTVLIDAFNWIGRAGDALGVPTDPEQFTDSLRQLHPLLRELAARINQSRILVFADGPDPGHRQLAENAWIHWSGGTGQHRADIVLLGHVRHLRSDPSHPTVFVVSDDQDVRRQALAYQAQIEECAAFARRIRKLLQG